VTEGVTDRTPRDDGFAMPAEWSPHQATLMAWPTRTRAELWGELFEDAQRDFAAVANAIVEFEPVVMVVDPEQVGHARALLSAGVELLPTPIDDSWIRDSGPIFVSSRRGEVALVHFGFNGWGERYRPYDRDSEVPSAIAAHLGMRRYVAPMILEGGAVTVDGEGTLLTTETCLLNPNRNRNLTRQDNERLLRDYLGADVVVWLPGGWMASRDTDGHVDGIAAYVAPGQVVLHASADAGDPDHERSAENRRLIEGTVDARGRTIRVLPIDPGATLELTHLNLYLTNGNAAIVPLAGVPQDEIALAQLREAMPDRQLVTVSGRVMHEGGGGPHCITQQVPVGRPAA
jgi:agmatine deiminase